MASDIDPERLSPVMVSRKLQVLGFIETYYTTHGAGPSLGEIAAAIGTSKSRIQDLVRRLAREGHIHRRPGVTRGLIPLSAREQALRVLADEGWTAYPPGATTWLRGTNESLPEAPCLDYLPVDEPGDSGDAGHDTGKHGDPS